MNAISETLASFNARDLRDACGSFATGVTVLTTRTKDGVHGMTANAFMSVSLEPPLLTISLAKGCAMLDKIRDSGEYAVNILAHDMEALALHFAGRHEPQFKDVLVLYKDMPVLPQAATIFLTKVVQEVEAGDHVLFLGQVIHIKRNLDKKPLVFCGGGFVQLEATE